MGVSVGEAVTPCSVVCGPFRARVTNLCVACVRNIEIYYLGRAPDPEVPITTQRSLLQRS